VCVGGGGSGYGRCNDGSGDVVSGKCKDAIGGDSVPPFAL
jgi:hypothetical protein